ncbi:MAG: hypothetical protein RL469_1282 [Pseudomonadota bacterium]
MKRRGPVLWLLAGLLAGSGALSAQDAARTEADLKQLRAEIERVRAQVAQDAAERDRLARSLREAEKSAGAARDQLDRVRGEREERERRRDMLARQRTEREAALAAERKALASQLRAAYLIGQREPVEMFLNQRDPELAGRMFSYYGYFGRARAGQINVIKGHLTEIATLDRQLETERERLARLESERQQEVVRLDQARVERGQVLAQLNVEARNRAAALQRLQREQAALEKLLRELRKAAQKFPPPDVKSPFANLRGKLGWPANGKVIARFGDVRAGTVKWDGVLIAAERGTPVRAVHQGRVVYADWLAGLGRLLIIDHGDGYLSLYGHNENLFRAVGDRVAAGDTVASVGDSGGSGAPGLYFEIRRGARPVDPVIWFRDKAP